MLRPVHGIARQAPRPTLTPVNEADGNAASGVRVRRQGPASVWWGEGPGPWGW